MAEDNRDNEVFIDADSGFSNDKDSYETLILKQIYECVKILSREMTGGQVIYKESKNGNNEKYIEDVRELVINHVDALRMLMSTYVKDAYKLQIKELLDSIEEYKINMGEQKINIPGKGMIPLKSIKGFDVNNPIWKEYIHFKAHKYREMFEILVNAFNNNRAYIRSLEEE